VLKVYERFSLTVAHHYLCIRVALLTLSSLCERLLTSHSSQLTSQHSRSVQYSHLSVAPHTRLSLKLMMCAAAAAATWRCSGFSQH